MNGKQSGQFLTTTVYWILEKLIGQLNNHKVT